MAGLKSKQMSQMHIAEAFWARLRALMASKLVGDVPLSGDNIPGEKLGRNADPLSVSTLARNFNVLTQKGQEMGAIIKSLAGIFTWRHPDRTLFCLMMFTWGSIYPHYFLIYPVLYILVFMSNKYLQKHPLKPMIVASDKPVGLDDGSMGIRALNYIESDMFGWLWEFNPNDVSDYYATSSKNLFEEVDNLLDDHELEDEGNHEASLLRNMEDIQHTTTKILRFIYSTESKINSYCSFINDLESTKLYLKMFTAITLAITLGPYIPWRIVFILTVWIVMLITHPNKSQLITSIIDSPTSSPYGEQRRVKKKADRGIFSNENIILDEPKLVKKVHVFELQQQSMTQENKYQSSKYTLNVFCISDEIRKQRKMPESTNTLNEIRAPSKWQFIYNSRWEIDTINEWVGETNIDNEVVIKDDNWVYDLTNEFRRRRLTRECSIESI